jgi:hypothetical protein
VSSNANALIVPPVETYDGETVEAAVAAARAHHGDNARLSEPYPVFKGGVAGFFANRRWAVDVNLSDEVSADEPSLSGDVAEAEALLSADPTPDALTLYTAASTTTPHAAGLPRLAAAPVEEHRVGEFVQPGAFAQALAAASQDATVARATHTVLGSTDPALTAPLDDQSRVSTPTFWPTAPATPAGDPHVTVGPSPFPSVTVIAPNVTVTPDLTVAPVPAWLRTALDGVDADLLDDAFATSVATDGAAVAVTALFAQHHRHPGMPVLDGGEVVVVAGIGAGVVASARSVAEFVGAPSTSVHAAGSSAAISEVHHTRRIKTVADATGLAKREQRAPVVVAVDLGWTGASDTLVEVVAALNPVATWAVVDATRRTTDLAAWLSRAGVAVDGLVVENVEHTSAVTDSLTLGAPIMFLDGRPATPKQWTGLIMAGAC